MEKKRIPAPAVGISTLLVIFAVLCLTVFALLSISTVNSDGRLGDAAQRAVTDYYRADAQAHSILARLRAGEIPPEVTEEEGVYRYRCTVSETQVLEVQVAVDGAQYQILHWQVVPTVNWQPEQTLPVWNGQ